MSAAVNKIALVTGASRGIGAATALKLARAGYDVGVNFRSNVEAAQAIVDEIESLGQNAVAIQADISVESEVERMFAEFDASLGTLTALINNAAILLPQGRLDTFTASRVNTLLATNVTGTILCCREAVRRMSKNRGGRGGVIVNVSSAASRIGSPNEYIDYAATKGAVDTLTIGLAQEVAQEGIRVNGVRPGFIKTEMHADGGEPNRLDRVKAFIPLRRGGEPEEVAATIAFLLSDEASYITGTFIDVAGGR